ncbi:MAG: site-specific integrase [Bacilli bacterium]|nr:site-specific integrase [Bacilli bacterium]
MAEVKLYSRLSKDGEKIYAEFYDCHGKRVRKSLNLVATKANMAYAQKHIVPEIERKIMFGVEFREYKLSEFTSMVLKFAKEERKINTYESYKFAIQKFFKIMGDMDVSKTRIQDIDRYINILKEDGASGATVALYLAPIRLAYNEAIRLEIIQRNPVAFAKKPQIKNKKKEVFNILQMRTLLDKAQDLLKLYLHFAFFTGARPNEIMALRWNDLKNDKVSITKTRVPKKRENEPKNGKPRTLMMLKPLKDFLDTQERARDELFPCTYGKMVQHFHALLDECGYNKRGLHTIRHTFTSLLIQARENPTLIQHFLGHADLTMINRVYAHYIEDEKDVERIEKVLSL